MIKLIYKLENQKLTDIKDRIEDLSLAYKLEKNEKVKTVSLEDGDLIYEGDRAVNNHIDQLEKDIRKWWYCDC